MFETIKACSSAIKLALMAAIAVAWWYHGHQRYNEGRAEVQALWDADKAQRKTIADKQATETAIFNQEKNDALKQTYARLSDTRSDLNAALKRLRDLSGVPRGEGVFVAVGGSSAMPGVAGNSSGTGISIENESVAAKILDQTRATRTGNSLSRQSKMPSTEDSRESGLPGRE